jgi:hypothetical protein
VGCKLLYDYVPIDQVQWCEPCPCP